MKKLLGFTLVELLVVVSIMGILATLIIANVTGGRSKASDSKIKSELEQLKTAMQLYYNDYQEYPAVSANKFKGCPGETVCVEGLSFSNNAATSIYMRQVPAYDTYSISGSTYKVCKLLENTSDPDITESQNKCGAAAEGQYCVCN